MLMRKNIWFPARATVGVEFAPSPTSACVSSWCSHFLSHPNDVHIRLIGVSTLTYRYFGFLLHIVYLKKKHKNYICCLFLKTWKSSHSKPNFPHGDNWLEKTKLGHWLSASLQSLPWSVGPHWPFTWLCKCLHLANLFYKGPVRKCFRLCRLCDVCCHYSARCL